MSFLLLGDNLPKGERRKSEDKTTVFYLYDGHGNVRILIDEAGVITDHYSYNAYGVALIKQGTTENTYLYCGEQKDETSGLYYLRARYMNPMTASFTQKDTYEGDIYEPVTLNGYMYTGGNPVNYVDPSGNSFSLAEAAATLKLMGITESIIQASYYLMIAGAVGAVITIGAYYYDEETISAIKERIISTLDQSKPYIPIFVMDEQVQEVIIDDVDNPEPFIEVFPQDEERYPWILLDPTIDGKSISDIIMRIKGGSKTGNWNKGSFDSAEDSLNIHFNKHGKEVGAETPEQYLRKAE